MKRFHSQFVGQGAGRHHDGVKHLAIEAHQVHLVHRQHHLADAQQRRNGQVAVRLFDESGPRIHQYNCHIGSGRSGDHVAGVLSVSGRVGQDETAMRRGEVPVRHVDGDALLALRPQTVGEQCQIRSITSISTRTLYRFELITHQRATVVE